MVSSLTHSPIIKDAEIAQLVKENTQLQLTKAALEARCKELDDIARRDSQKTLEGVKERDQLLASKNALEAHVKGD